MDKVNPRIIVVNSQRTFAVRVTVVVSCVCVCACVHACMHTCVRVSACSLVPTVSLQCRKIFLILFFAKNASFRSYGVVQLPPMPPTTLKPQKTDTKGINEKLERH